MRILAIDPGFSTGMAYINYNGFLTTGYIATTVGEVIQRLREIRNSDFTVVVEDFVGAGPRTKEAIFVLKYIGSITAACQIFELPCHLQAPQQRIPLLSTAKAQVQKGTIIHIVDAYAHALAFLEREKGSVLSF